MSRRCWPRSRRSSCRCRSIRPAAGYRSTIRRVTAGVKLAFVDNSPAGLRARQGLCDHRFRRPLPDGSTRPASPWPRRSGKKGKVGYIFHDADFYVTNQRDQAFKTTIEQDYPDMTIAAEAGHGRSRPAAEEIAQAMVTQQPGSRRHLRHLGRAGAERAVRAAFCRQHPHEDRHARPQRAGRARHGQGRQRSRRWWPTRPIISASRRPGAAAGSRCSASRLTRSSSSISLGGHQGHGARTAGKRR